ncbi:hypothetical protein SANA_01160 [Gottschalkiaceae bacterium SANA]|nr:hypothetical protein SANA_01160 [Gottschalkiaceae bacterium SANA]
MARPLKEGIDYFSLDVFPDEKVGYLEATYGAEGYYFWIKLLQKIFANGYYIKWTKFSVAAMKRATGIDMEKIKEILECCLEADLFSRSLYEGHGVITSRGVQKRFYMAARKRKEVNVIPEYVLHDKLMKWYVGNNPEETYEQSSNGQEKPDNNQVLNDDNAEEIPLQELNGQQKLSNNHGSEGLNEEKTSSLKEFPQGFCEVNAEETISGNKFPEGFRGNNPDETRKKSGQSTQSKVKESKVKKSKEEKSKDLMPSPPKITYAENVKMTEQQHQKLIDELGEVGTKWVIDKLSAYKTGNGKKYESDYHVMRNWVIGEYLKRYPERGVAHAGLEPDLSQRDWNKF